MGDVTGIEWTDHTFNPWMGCVRVSPGCEHCYAEARVVTRMKLTVWGPAGPVYMLGKLRVTISEEPLAAGVSLMLGISRGDGRKVSPGELQLAVKTFGRGALEWESSTSPRVQGLVLLETILLGN